MKTIDHIADKVAKVVEYVVIVLFVITLSACVLQVFTRYVLNNSLRWTDELARYTFIYGNVLGAVLMQRIHGHAAVTALVGLLPKAGQKVMELFTSFIILGISAVLVYSGIQMIQRTTRQLSPGMNLPMSYIYASIAIGGVLFFFFTAVDIAHQFIDFKKDDTSSEKGVD